MRPFRKGGHSILVGPRRLLCALTLLLTLTGLLAPSVAGAADAGPTPIEGGHVTTASGDLSILDPANSGALASNDGVAAQILGALFLPPATADGTPVSDLATAYRFNRAGTAVTITLRRGVHFSDGTPFDPAALIWNLHRTATSGAFDATLLAGITNMVSSGPNTVTIIFSASDFGFIPACVSTAICDMASPTSYAILGAQAFAAAPVGAGPFRVVRNRNSILMLAKSSSYWDAPHVYLARWTLEDLGSDDPGTIYQAVIEDTIQGASFDGIATSPSILYQVAKNHNVSSRTTANLDYGFLPLDAFKMPFSDQRAREALDYCTDRTALAKSESVTDGYATPAYVLAGSASEYLPSPGGIRGAETLMPYRYDVAQGLALVDQLGGLSFQLDAGDGEPTVIANALATQWAACGIHAQVTTLSDAQLALTVASGAYQAAFVEVPGAANPATSMTLEAPASPLDVPGLSDPKLASLASEAAATASTSKLAGLWHQIWFEENSDAIDIPVLSSGATVVVSHCIRDLGYSFGIAFLHAWLTCPD
jgi:peptide/nickel transport system substrate-binding protein